MKSIYIILINYNNSEDTIECLISLLRCNYDDIDFKILVIDNNSRPKELNKLKKFSGNYILIELQNNLGFAGANNVGIRRAIKNKIDFVLLLNNDTIVDKNFIKEMYKRADRNTVIVPKIYYFSDKNKIWYAGGAFNKDGDSTYHIGVGAKDNGQYEKVMQVNFASGCCMLIPLNIIKNIGLLSEEYFMYYEDADFCKRIVGNNYKILYIPYAKIWHKIGSASGGESSEFVEYYMTKSGLKFTQKYCNNKVLVKKLIFLGLRGIKGKILKRKSNVILKAIYDWRKEK